MAGAIPLKIDAGEVKQFQSGDVVPVAFGGTGVNTLSLENVLKISSDSAGTVTSTANTNITDWIFAVSSNKDYDVHGWMHIDDALAAGGIKFAATIPVGATMDINFFGTTSSNTLVASLRITTSGTLTTSAYVTEAQGRYVFFRGGISIGATSGNFQFQAACGASSQTSIIKKLGSSLYYLQTN